MKNYERKYKEIMCELEKSKTEPSYKIKKEICQKIFLTRTIYTDRQIVKDMMGLKSILEVDDELLLNIEEVEELMTTALMIVEGIDELTYKELGKIKILVYWGICELFKDGTFTKDMFYKKFEDFTEYQRNALFSGKYSKIV
jgi:hypothetical protein